MMIPSGKGIFIWKLKNCASGNMQLLANMAQAAGFSWVAIKAVDRIDNFNQANPSYYGPDLLGLAVDKLRAVGIKVWGWGYAYGANWLGQSIAAAEGNKVVENIKRFNFEGWLIDVEKEYKRSGAAAWADTFLNVIKSALPEISLGLCSYRFPTLHPELPWHNFLRHCNFHAPQVYWLLANNPGAQLQRSVRELQALANLPVVPVGCAYYDTTYKWQPSIGQINEFNQTAKDLKLPGITWWEWEENMHGAQYIAPIWEAISAHDWGQPALPPQDWAHAITDWARTKGYTGPEPG